MLNKVNKVLIKDVKSSVGAEIERGYIHLPHVDELYLTNTVKQTFKWYMFKFKEVVDKTVFAVRRPLMSALIQLNEIKDDDWMNISLAKLVKLESDAMRKVIDTDYISIADMEDSDAKKELLDAINARKDYYDSLTVKASEVRFLKTFTDAGYTVMFRFNGALDNCYVLGKILPDTLALIEVNTLKAGEQELLMSFTQFSAKREHIKAMIDDLKGKGMIKYD